MQLNLTPEEQSVLILALNQISDEWSEVLSTFKAQTPNADELEVTKQVEKNMGHLKNIQIQLGNEVVSSIADNPGEAFNKSWMQLAAVDDPRGQSIQLHTPNGLFIYTCDHCKASLNDEDVRCKGLDGRTATPHHNRWEKWRAGSR